MLGVILIAYNTICFHVIYSIIVYKNIYYFSKFIKNKDCYFGASGYR